MPLKRNDFYKSGASACHSEYPNRFTSNVVNVLPSVTNVWDFSECNVNTDWKSLKRQSGRPFSSYVTCKFSCLPQLVPHTDFVPLQYNRPNQITIFPLQSHLAQYSSSKCGPYASNPYDKSHWFQQRRNGPTLFVINLILLLYAKLFYLPKVNISKSKKQNTEGLEKLHIKTNYQNKFLNWKEPASYVKNLKFLSHVRMKIITAYLLRNINYPFLYFCTAFVWKDI